MVFEDGIEVIQQLFWRTIIKPPFALFQEEVEVLPWNAVELS